jgi:hypothetical protein
VTGVAEGEVEKGEMEMSRKARVILLGGHR